MMTTATLRHYALSLAVATLLCACSGLPVTEATDQLKTKPICCRSYGDLTFEPLILNQRRKTDLDKSSPVMEFPEGRSYVVAFALPPNSLSISIQSIHPAYLPKTSYVDPIVLVLDKDKKPIARFGELELRTNYHSYYGFREYYFGCRILLPPDSSYIVVYADNKSRRVQQAISANGTPWPAPPVPIGTLGLIVQ